MTKDERRNFRYIVDNRKLYLLNRYFKVGYYIERNQPKRGRFCEPILVGSGFGLKQILFLDLHSLRLVGSKKSYLNPSSVDAYC